ncbi:MAG: phasin superfamily protein [Desulfuromonas sp.]|uniref:phasin family protein n=1 Tax=Desulfuromonas sp. TaxID=892 RepID=UPI000CA7E710|nr:phasin family protein [Desulfuromonas sp.]PLX85839.1 MAG: phasin superfamily protein [Desulfuromonas sp.]
MFELIEKTLLLGMGAMSLSQKKAEELLEELRHRFDVSEEEGKAMLEKIQETMRENQKKLEELAAEEVKKACERLGVATSEEFEKLQQRVHKLENQIKQMSKPN